MQHLDACTATLHMWPEDAFAALFLHTPLATSRGDCWVHITHAAGADAAGAHAAAGGALTTTQEENTAAHEKTRKKRGKEGNIKSRKDKAARTPTTAPTQTASSSSCAMSYVTHDTPPALAAAQRITSLLSQALGDRVVLCHITPLPPTTPVHPPSTPKKTNPPMEHSSASSSPTNANVDPAEGAPRPWDLPCHFLVSIQLNPSAAMRVLDMGPEATDTTGVGQFRAFWGTRAELRRFKVCVCVWGGGSVWGGEVVGGGCMEGVRVESFLSMNGGCCVYCNFMFYVYIWVHVTSTHTKPHHTHHTTHPIPHRMVVYVKQWYGMFPQAHDTPSPTSSSVTHSSAISLHVPPYTPMHRCLIVCCSMWGCLWIKCQLLGGLWRVHLSA